MMSSTTMCFLFAVVVCSVAATTSGCSFMSYYNRDLGKCVPCSVCYPDQVPHRQCYGEQDTVCGPLPAFPFEDVVGGGEKATENTPEKAKKSPESSSSSVDAPRDRYQTATSLVLTEDNTNEEKWFTITMVLVGVLVLTCIVGVVAGLVFCVAYKQKQREIICEPSYTTIPLTKDDYPRIEQFQLVRET